VAEDSVDVFGIRHITDKDIRAFKKMGRVCKLMVKAKKHKDGISAYVEPALLPLSAPESSVTMNFNMTTLVGKNIGRLSLMGQGAGKYPHRQLAGAGYAGHKVQRNRPVRAEESHTCG
jgi:Homoserine dehydrogenase